MPLQAADIAMTDPSLNVLFEESIEAIRTTISEEEHRNFRHYGDITSMIQDLRSLCASNQKEHQRLLSCSRKIALFSHTFAPYFDIINNFVRIRPDWLGWFWGSIRLVFKIGSNYILFLEKIADMFESIAHVLPRYTQFHDTCRRQFQETRHDWPTSLMSYLYAEIIQFCLELYRIFSRGSQGVGLRHRIGFLTTVLWEPLDSRFSQLQERLVKHKRWFETELQVQNFELLVQHRKEFFRFLQIHGQVNGYTTEAERMLRRSKRIHRIKSWLSSFEYREIYERSTRQRHPNSGSWFLNTAEYCKWKNAPFSDATANNLEALKANWHDRILFVQAKPGFGKTSLSGQIIDDLNVGAAYLNISDEPPTTAFFHFSSIHPNSKSANDALRALAAQLVHSHRDDRNTLDALALLVREASGQERASFDDAVATLRLLLRQHSTFLVIDGIDECSDSELLLTLIPELCRNSDCRVVILSRPDIPIPLEYQEWASGASHILYLNDSPNAADIESYITLNLSTMADQGFFGISMDRSLIPAIAGRANGMFLWATLLVKYLRSPGLSPQERRVALEQASLLEGLESLYRGILKVLSRSFDKEKNIAADIFRWLSLSIKPLGTEALHTALAITSGRPTTDDQRLLDFTDSISRLTCALVEVTDGSVSFIHRSVKEYLQSPQCQDSDFSLFDECAVHAHLAARCISYLANDVPKRPLQKLEPYRPSASLATSSGISFRTSRTSRSADSGYRSMSSSDTDAMAMGNHETSFDTNMPFLRYAALCWPIHLTRALSSPTPRPSPTLRPFPVLISPHNSDPYAFTPWLSSLSRLLTDRPALTTWVEASWRYDLPPNLSRLVPVITTMKSEIPPATIEGRELRWVVHGLRQLSEALNELRGDYGVTLRENPSLIWQWNIQAATEGGFWPVWDERKGCVHGLEA
ncbi:hypothetical protein K469DRAFT_185232 [Zopfia rhizophila CBS 207.26]|uniref:Uncharacterized protein n=1 Tax=Zopfia rhizophila CBS 207.26 TaxID=1314779 RepID=A0A6A6E3J1_9PEZI|nr:hypothetical protein K469DRAFT_185232 [Zopfia rhizophila CBS 207.26]